MDNLENLQSEKVPKNPNQFTLELQESEQELNAKLLWQAKTGLNQQTLKAAIETIIFMSNTPISIQKIRELIDFDIPLSNVNESLVELMAQYEDQGHGIRLQEVAQGFQFRTKAFYSKYIRDLYKVNSLMLTPAVLEVLAIIAYNQPASKNAIEKIRGVDSSHLIRILIDKKLVRVLGRGDELGKPTVYGTTREFLEVFNLKDLSDLPPQYHLEELVESNEVGELTQLKSLMSKKNTFHFDEMDEIDELSAEIKKIPSETDFIKELKNKKTEKNNVDDPRNKEMLDGEKKVEKIAEKTAFDILEDYLEREKIKSQNQASVQSEHYIDLDLNLPEINVDIAKLKKSNNLNTSLDIKDDSLE